MAEIEHACLISELPDESPHGFSRLYYGAEFCFWRLPSANNILTAREWAKSRGLSFTLLTPLIGEAERSHLDVAFEAVLPSMLPGDEIVISDWGSIELIHRRREDLEIVVGRALSGQKRGPRILGMDLTDEQEEYFKRGAWHNREAVEVLLKYGVRRVEQDNLLQGIAPLPESLTGSLHVPFAMVTSSRSCPFRAEGTFGPCPAPCGEKFTLKSTETDMLLYQDGNTQFLRNDVVPDNLHALGITRIVTSMNFL